MTPGIDPLKSAPLSVAEASTDVRGRYGAHCKTVYTGSIPVVASIILRTNPPMAKVNQAGACWLHARSQGDQSHTIRRWRWTFWLVVVAFAAGVIRIPASALQIARVLPLDVPLWYAILRALIGVIQVLIAIVMIRAYRRGGVWAA